MRTGEMVLACLLSLANAGAGWAQATPAAVPSVITIQTATRLAAMEAASAWINDRSKHGQIYVHGFTINPGPNGKYTARIEYTGQ
jgi:hypothetical protein